MMNRLQTISHAENVRFVKNHNLADESEKKQKENEVLNEILALCQGDMRRAVTTLQSAHLLSMGNGVDGGGFIQSASIAEMAGLPPSSVVTSLLEILQSRSSSYDTMDKSVKEIMLDGYSAHHIMKDLLKRITKMDSKVLSDIYKAQIAIKIAEADKNLVDSADETLQLMVICSLILKCFRSAPSV
jgi:replication factor C subunit 2/4